MTDKPNGVDTAASVGTTETAPNREGLASKPTVSTTEDFVRQLLERVMITDGFETNYRAQSEVLTAIGDNWPAINDTGRGLIYSMLCYKIPRIANTKLPAQTFDQLMEMHQLFKDKGGEDLGKSLKSYGVKPEYQPDSDDAMFRVGGWIGNYLTYAQDCEVPIAFHFWTAISLIGSVARYKIWIDRGKYTLRLNNYVLLSASKAGGKSAAKDIGKEILGRLNRIMNPNPYDRSTPHRNTIRMLAEDSTKESMIDDLKFGVLVDNDPKTGLTKEYPLDSTGMLFLDELANLLGRTSHSAESFIPFLTTLFSGGDYRKATKTQGRADLRNCSLSILACCAPSWFEDAITPIMFTGGFLDRWRMVYRPDGHSPRIYSRPVDSDPLFATELARQLLPIAMMDEPRELIPTNEAEEFFDGWYRACKIQERTDMFSGEDHTTIQRLGNQIWKLAGCLAISDGKMPYIETSHVRSAVEILQHEESFLSIMLRRVNLDKSSAKMELVEKILLKRGGITTRRVLCTEVRNKPGFKPFKKNLDPVIDDLIRMGRINVIEGTSATITFYELTPTALLEWAKKTPDSFYPKVAIREHAARKLKIAAGRHKEPKFSALEYLVNPKGDPPPIEEPKTTLQAPFDDATPVPTTEEELEAESLDSKE